MSASSSFGRLEPGMRAALHQAWAAVEAGSLGIGAAALDDAGAVLAVGRNRLHESDPGDDALAGTSLAHAELNVLAKLPFRAHESVVLHTTLQPCLQCLAAIRLSSVSRVHVLAPDPLWRGIERIRDVTSFVARRWPSIEQHPVDEWSAFALLSPTRHMSSHPQLGETWTSTLPGVTAVSIAAEADRLFHGADSVVEAADRVWDQLSACIDEVAAVADDPGPAPGDPAV
ncbi:hypothetical protein [Ilumatobacter sp.]|uniref:hypothetical protein n=1 Tax=Ilumatobacter sp. TaxID=1967498 RepID=UPI003AF5732A